jgi:predicted amidohydrolase YtcJ
MSSRHSRREFMGLAAAGAAGAFVRPRFEANPRLAELFRGTPLAPDADLVVYNAKVYTMDAATPRAEAFAAKNGRFIAVGSTADIRGLIGKGTRAVDAKQMTIVPGFTDCHNHAGGTTLLYEVLVGNPFEVEFVTIQSIIDKLRAKAQQTPPGTWVEGYFHDDTKLKDKRPLNRHDLDKVSTEHPVAVQHRGGHTSFYNTKALELAGITRTRRIRRAVRSIATRAAISMAGSPIARAVR